MEYVLKNTDYKIVMLYRSNVEWLLKPRGEIRELNGLNICTVDRCVACYMMET
jgi:hypothetical protein